LRKIRRKEEGRKLIRKLVKVRDKVDMVRETIGEALKEGIDENSAWETNV
jgi:hypothetical protein